MVKISYTMSAENYSAIQKAIDFHLALQKAFFWLPSTSAIGRKNNNKKWNEKSVNGNFSFIQRIQYEKRESVEFSCKLTINQSYSESCKNVYHISNFFINNEKTTVRKIKNLLDRSEIL